MTYKKISKSYGGTLKIAETFAKYCESGANLLLDGDLAAGKTVFAKGVGVGLGVDDNIKSPSYTLMCSYHGRLPFFHFDAYNLQGIDDFYSLGFDEFLYENGVSLIEWASVISEGFPEDYVHIQIDKGEGEDLRLLTFTPHGATAENLLKVWWEHENTGL